MAPKQVVPRGQAYTLQPHNPIQMPSHAHWHSSLALRQEATRKNCKLARVKMEEMGSDPVFPFPPPRSPSPKSTIKPTNAMINTVWGSTDKPVASKRLAQILGAEADLEGALYIGHPIIGTPEGSFPIDGEALRVRSSLVASTAAKTAIKSYKARPDPDACCGSTGALGGREACCEKRSFAPSADAAVRPG